MTEAVWSPPATALVVFLVSSFVQNILVGRRAKAIADRGHRAARPHGTEVRDLGLKPLRQELFEDAERIQLAATFFSTLPALLLIALQDVPTTSLGFVFAVMMAVVVVFGALAFIPNLPHWLTKTRFLGTSFLSLAAFFVLVVWLIIAVASPAHLGGHR